MKYFFLYLIIINVVSFITMAADKYYARNHRWRISENTLMILAVVGGSVGSIAGMFLLRHKTKHLKFLFGLPAIFLVQCIAAMIIAVKVL